MVKLIQLLESCPTCGKNKFMEEISHVNGREEKRYTCLFCVGSKEKNVQSCKPNEKFKTRRFIRRIHTKTNIECD